MQITDPHKYYLVDQFNKNPSIAFVIDRPTATQKSFSLFTKINRFLDKESLIELSAYTVKMELPITLPNFAVYQVGEVNDYSGCLIATDFYTLPYVLETDRASKYLYVYDIHQILDLRPEEIEHLKKINMKIFTRTKEYKRVIESRGLPVMDILVPDFEIEEIIKICQQQ